jgi:alanine-synthesizing transaminase
MFSAVALRLHADKNPLYRRRDELQSQGIILTDLISGNVNEQGILFPQEALVEILVRAAHRCTIYRPDSFGQKAAREAICAHYAARGISIPAENFLLTPGTSIAYWYSFRLLADEGDEILCPSPSYPLFDYIAALSGVRLIPYRLEEKDGWAIDREYLESVVSTRTRAIVLISPHNPTGYVASREEIAAMAEVAARHDLAIISDEVFSEFLIAGDEFPRAAASSAPLVLTLNGFSKMYALPGIKLGWMAVSGELKRVARALQALELISDTFLPVSEFTQAAVGDIFRMGEEFLADYARQVRERWRLAHSELSAGNRCKYVAPGGGFYVTLRLDDSDEEGAALKALNDEHLLVHPGYYYDMKPHHLVISFIQHPDVLRNAMPRLLRALG